MYLNKAKKIVLKIGSSNLVDNRGNLKEKYINFMINPVGCIKKIDIRILINNIMKEIY